MDHCPGGQLGDDPPFPIFSSSCSLCGDRIGCLSRVGWPPVESTGQPGAVRHIPKVLALLRSVYGADSDGDLLVGPGTPQRALRVPKGKNAQIRIYSKTWNGRQLVDIRVYALFSDSEDFTPTRKGISFDAGKLKAVLGGLALATQYTPQKAAMESASLPRA